MKLSSIKTARGRPLFARTAALTTFDDWLQLAIELYEREGVALGQIATIAHDEALYLLLRTLGLPLDSDVRVLDRQLTKIEIATIKAILQRRIADRVPAAYLTREAYLGEHRFYVDERVIIPRSYFLEIIPHQLDQWLPDPKKVRRVADVCTGSGCLAILLADHFPKAKVDAIDLSPDALEVAKINVAEHGLAKRIALHESNVFDAVPKAKYDIILCNPPYEPSAHVDAMPKEFHREPRMSLDGGADGLDIIRKLLRQSRDRLVPHGLVLIEVGGLRETIDREFAALDPHWLLTEDGTDCVCAIHAKLLKTANI
jgi:ribosomal protein L3 glutamine methyltransferase